MANEVIRARYKGKDTGEGLPHFHGVPARDLTDEDFDALSAEDKETVRKSNLYDYTPYTERARRTSSAPPARETPANTEEVK